MTNEEAKKMLKAKLECFKNETSGINHDCNMRLCDGCSLNYEQGNMGEQKEALQMAIKALEQQPCEDAIKLIAQQRWIPVSEILPEERGFYLTTTKDKTVYCDYWNEDNFDRTEMVIAWMPLPQPYKAENKTKQGLAYADQDTMMPAT